LKYFTLVFILILSGCSIKNYEHSSSKLIIIKTQKLKFADLGYVKHSDNAVRLELFVAGSNVENMSINHLVCLNEGCFSKSRFNAEYLNASYPDSLLQNVILGHTIYNEKNLKHLDGGFEQAIENENVAIIYRVSASIIYFKDKKNRIIFKIKDIQ